MKNTTSYVEIRSQKSVGSSSGGFGGPDAYVMVQTVPDGAKRLKVLNREIAKKRGIVLTYCGEGYSKNTATMRSSLRQAIAEAEKIAGERNKS